MSQTIFAIVGLDEFLHSAWKPFGAATLATMANNVPPTSRASLPTSGAFSRYNFRTGLKRAWSVRRNQPGLPAYWQQGNLSPAFGGEFGQSILEGINGLHLLSATQPEGIIRRLNRMHANHNNTARFYAVVITDAEGNFAQGAPPTDCVYRSDMTGYSGRLLIGSGTVVWMGTTVLDALVYVNAHTGDVDPWPYAIPYHQP